jgi:hypothetical protein
LAIHATTSEQSCALVRARMALSLPNYSNSADFQLSKSPQTQREIGLNRELAS